MKRAIRWAVLLTAVLLLFASCDPIANLLGIDSGDGGPQGNWNEAVWNENNWQ